MRTVTVCTLALALAACGGEAGDAPLSAEDRDDREFLDSFAPPDDPMFVFDDSPWLEQRPAAYLPDGTLAPEQAKGGLPQLMGWGFMGVLADQDGVPGAAGRDHCELFGLQCDGIVHAQMRKLLFNNVDDIYAEGMGGCGSFVTGRGGQPAAFMPCATAYLTGADREITWRVAVETCPNNATGRSRMIEGMRAVERYMNRSTSVQLREVSSGEEFRIECDPGMLTTGVSATWHPVGQFTLHYALQESSDESGLTLAETCESPGLPGSGSSRQYRQSIDMVYSYPAAVVTFNWEDTFAKIAECSGGASQTVRALRNTFLHELGHHLGFHHETYDDFDFGLMLGGPRSCEEVTEWPMGFDTTHLLALLSLDHSTNTDALEVYDWDLSCYQPSGW